MMLLVCYTVCYIELMRSIQCIKCSAFLFVLFLLNQVCRGLDSSDLDLTIKPQNVYM